MTQFYPDYSWEPFNNIGYLLRRANLLMISRLEVALAPYELTFVQWLIMLHLDSKKARTAAELCREIHYDSGALTRIIDHLSQRGFIERNRSNDDRRLVDLNITVEGRNLLKSIKPAIAKCLNATVAGLSGNETKTLLDLLTKMVRGMAASDEAVPALAVAVLSEIL